MALFLDLESLASLLDEEPETDVEAEEQEPVNSYLLHEVLPLLELGLYPRLVSGPTRSPNIRNCEKQPDFPHCCSAFPITLTGLIRPTTNWGLSIGI